VTEIDSSRIRAAVEILRRGGLVAFATETVYGLGADATNPRAVRRIYEAKGRPPGNPLIVHVSDEAMARKYAGGWPADARVLARALWPGPLTLVVPRGPAIASQVSAGLLTMGVRAPHHPVAQALLRAFDGPIAAPSANRSNQVSPTTAEHVRSELGSAVDLILDGGPCEVGIESTVVDVSRTPAAILRPGNITAAQIADLIGLVDTRGRIAESLQPVTSPGQQPVHYAPRTPAFRLSAGPPDDLFAWRRANADAPAAILLLQGSSSVTAVEQCLDRQGRIVLMPPSATQYAHRLYAVLHELDAGGFSALWIEVPPDVPQWTAVRDRILRATRDYVPV
jgi:L-threonylcarbamoyladenylate synthase